MNHWEFANGNPFAALLMVCFASLTVAIVCYFIQTAWRQLLRYRVIIVHGYPPEHTDADGGTKSVIKKPDGTVIQLSPDHKMSYTDNNELTEVEDV